jgi:type II secretory ATPase GspE/PulE/Tfp pilus assembly ATPase PilB-like protein
MLPGHNGDVFGPVGCRTCNHTGYSGRSAITETMPMSPKLRHAASERASTQLLRDTAMGEGLISLREGGLRLVREGTTSLAEILRNTHAGTLGG